MSKFSTDRDYSTIVPAKPPAKPPTRLWKHNLKS
jgi:hypothetical protein